MKLFDELFLADLVSQAKASPRKRANQNIHATLDDTVQRLFIAMEPGSYVQPHSHLTPEKWEFFMVVRGRLLVLLFDDAGRVTQREIVTPTEAVGFEIPAGVWHSVLALQSGSVFMEVKKGPYSPLPDKDFAKWAPKEGALECPDYWGWMESAKVGDVSPEF